METIALDKDTLAGLLKTNAPIRKYRYVPKNKHIVWYDTGFRCAARGCNSPTYLKIDGIPRCLIHALDSLADILNTLEGGE